MAELMDEVRSRRPGHSLEVTVVRDGTKRRMTISLTDKTSGSDADTITPTTSTSVPGD
jgi:S1-C subfamily serine protease